MAKVIKIAKLVHGLAEAYERHDGYVMCATGQDPKKWAKDSWWFTQYSGKQREKALYWREHAARVWDCNGLAEGLYKDETGIDINTKARYNYADWCGIKGTGMIPEYYRTPGAAVFWGDTAKSIHHVAYLWKPVNERHPEKDWFLIEARGVMYGVVCTRLSERKPNYWGLMTKYWNYKSVEEYPEPTLGDRVLKNGCEGNDVKLLQSALIRLGYDCGKWGVDGDFGDATEQAVKDFQVDHNLKVDGIAGWDTLDAIQAALVAHDKQETERKRVKIVGGNCYVRDKANTNGAILGVAHAGETLPWRGEIADNGWLVVEYKDKSGWVSGKYGELV